ncbi:recombination regulator RecX [Tetragenococcus osmophilus]|uniref:Regulatory protein RecX n=1 Tax=Tetragenococcus osmophilus TaxID=526944 RepID=A0ABM7A9Z3_9ENTE|nr:recombination regulator RecX [Tetragenococcus osmophilus]AYW48361.1 recombination regulator RecX [Tetragenococcus osmophilus]
MYTVTSIQKLKGTFYQVTIDHQEKIKVSEDLLVRFRLLKGSELSEEQMADVKEQASYDFGLQEALNYISYQLRTEKEVRTYLQNKEIPLEDRHKIVTRLKELGVLNDQTYAVSYVRTQIRLSDKGPANLTQQLRKKGVQDDLIAEAMELYTPELQAEIAANTAVKGLKKIRGKSHHETLQKLRLNLIKKGFNQDIAQQAIEGLDYEIDESQEWETLQKEGQKLLKRDRSNDSSKKKMKLKQKLYQKGFTVDMIQKFIDEEVLDEK